MNDDMKNIVRVYESILSGLDGGDTPEMRAVCLNCKVAQDRCNGECKRILAMAKGKPDPGEKYAGVNKVTVYSTEQRREIRRIIADTGADRGWVYRRLKKGIDIETIRHDATEKMMKKEAQAVA